ncbi:MAG: DUF4321 domain-containing protein [Clostridiales bacterium]|nr:DUF4321 domain-containing protein [Clostridiales bacterium]
MDGKNGWSLLIMLLAGLVIGGFLGFYLGQYPALSWLNYGKTFGLDQPFDIDLGIIHLVFGINFNISISGILGLALGAFAHKRL